MNIEVNRYKIREVGWQLEDSCSLIEDLIEKLKKSVASIGDMNDAEELDLFVEIFNGSAVQHLTDMKEAIGIWALKMQAISQVYNAVQQECYQKIMNCQ